MTKTRRGMTTETMKAISALKPTGSLLLLSTLALTACGSGEGGSGGQGEPGEIVTGGALRFAVGTDAGCVDPHQVGSNDSIYSTRQLVDSLTDQDPETGEIVPWLAEEWDVNDDASEFTFTLRDGVTFSNGDPVDSEAVAANFDAVEELGARATLVAGFMEGYEGTEIEDERTFTVQFDGPNAQFLQATSTHSLGILAPETVEQDEDERCQEVIGSGPFVLDDYSANNSITLGAREDYDWGSPLWENQSAPHLDSIEFTVVPESGVRAGSIQSDQVDVIGPISTQDQAQLEASNAQLLDRINPGAAFGLTANNEHPFLSEQPVREAISHAIDREEIVNTVFTEFTPVASSVLASTTPDHIDLSEYLDFDPDHSVELLEEAGFDRTDQGWERDGELMEFEIAFWDNNAANAPAMELVQQQLASIDIPVTLREVPIAEASTVRSEGDYDVVWRNTTRAEPDILRGHYLSTGANEYRMPASELDDLLLEQNAEPDPDTRAELNADIQEIIVSDYNTIPVVEQTAVLAARETVHGVRFDSGSRVHLNDVWIEDADS